MNNIMAGHRGKIAPAGIAVVMLAGLLAGCGGDKKEGAASPSAGATPAGASKAPAGSASPTPAAKLEPVTLTWYMLGSPQPDQDAVFAEANKIIKEKLNATVDFKIIANGEYDAKMKVKIAAGEDWDLAFTSSWANNYFQNAGKGTYLDVSQLLDKYAPKRKAAVPQNVWDGLKIGGKLYGLVNGYIAWQDGIYIQKDYVKKYNVDTASIKSLKDLEPLLATIKKNEPDKIPFGMTKGGINNWGSIGNGGVELFIGAGIPVAVMRSDKSAKAFNVLELPETKAYFELLHDWYGKGYISKDAPTIADKSADLKAGKIVVDMANTIYPGVEGEVKNQFGGRDVSVIETSKPFVVATSTFSTMTAINARSKNPERAMMLYELVNNDRDLFKLLGAGIKDKHYTQLENNTIKLIPNSGYAPGNNWAWGDLDRTGYLVEGQPAGMLEGKIKSSQNADVSSLIGFSFDTTPVKTEFAQITSVAQEYGPLLMTGASDPGKVLPEYIDKLKKAGLDKLLAEVQKQIDDWKKTK
ncbi:MAG: ABC transporter substrate-binding protein [Paenibacillaceae bacterium]|nr:ABC transporter substrate-binding protein [Paenibacillaceae bacterium]